MKDIVIMIIIMFLTLTACSSDNEAIRGEDEVIINDIRFKIFMEDTKLNSKDSAKIYFEIEYVGNEKEIKLKAVDPIVMVNMYNLDKKIDEEYNGESILVESSIVLQKGNVYLYEYTPPGVNKIDSISEIKGFKLESNGEFHIDAYNAFYSDDFELFEYQLSIDFFVK